MRHTRYEHFFLWWSIGGWTEPDKVLRWPLSIFERVKDRWAEQEAG